MPPGAGPEIENNVVSTPAVQDTVLVCPGRYPLLNVEGNDFPCPWLIEVGGRMVCDKNCKLSRYPDLAELSLDRSVVVSVAGALVETAESNLVVRRSRAVALVSVSLANRVETFPATSKRITFNLLRGLYIPT